MSQESEPTPVEPEYTSIDTGKANIDIRVGRGQGAKVTITIGEIKPAPAEPDSTEEVPQPPSHRMPNGCFID